MNEIVEQEEGIDCTIEEVLDYCKNSEIIIIPREKNEDFKYKSGLTTDDLINHVKSLETRHFKEKIDDLDPKHTGKMYVFKKWVTIEYWCYIKIKINKVEGGSVVVVISFHDDE